jgi:hypothetical protein
VHRLFQVIHLAHLAEAVLNADGRHRNRIMAAQQLANA